MKKAKTTLNVMSFKKVIDAYYEDVTGDKKILINSIGFIDIFKKITENIDSKSIGNNQLMGVKIYKEVLFDVYKQVEVYISLYSDILRLYDNSDNCKLKENSIHPHSIEIIVSVNDVAREDLSYTNYKIVNNNEIKPSRMYDFDIENNRIF